MAGFLVRRRRDARELEAHDADMAKRAASALLAADERIGLAQDELGFAEAAWGAEATARLGEAVATARGTLNDAFRLLHLNQESAPGTIDLRRARNVRIAQMCEWIDDLLDAETSVRSGGVAAESVDESSDESSDGPGDGFRDVGRWVDPVADRLPHIGVARMQVQLHRAVEAADLRLDLARDAVLLGRGRVGEAARARLAESEHLRADLGHCLGEAHPGAPVAVTVMIDPAHRERLFALAQRIVDLANDAVLLARRDLRAPIAVGGASA